MRHIVDKVIVKCSSCNGVKIHVPDHEVDVSDLNNLFFLKRWLANNIQYCEFCGFKELKEEIRIKDIEED